MKDHPRVCGEQNGRMELTAHHPGSPPRVRGTGRLHQGRHPLGRITPACAGNSYYNDIDIATAKDHPRVCGEQALFLNIQAMMIGSPPRVRGTV